MRTFILLIVFAVFGLKVFAQQPPQYDIIIRNGIIYDGNGSAPYSGGIAIQADTIAFMGDLKNAQAKIEIDAGGKAIAPGFINMMGHSEESLFADGRAQSDIRQGVTTEIFDEFSMGPLNEVMKDQLQKSQGDILYPVTWNTLGEYMNILQKKGISVNIASYVGAGTVRQYVIGEDNKDPSQPQLDSMKQLVAGAMSEGALGLTTALIYPPDNFAKTDELIALARVASDYGGTYISHIRGEGNQLIQSVNEILRIAKEANIPVEICHLKAAGRDNWNKMDSVIMLVENARKQGIDITADMYTYTASATGLTSCFPPDLQDGGFGKLRERLQEPAIRKQMITMMHTNATDWENLYYGCGGASNILLISFKQDSLKKYTGKTLEQVAAIRRKTPEETAMDLIIDDSTRIGVVYFLMDENNIKKEIVLPWVCFGSDEAAYSTEGVFLKSFAHPRAYGNFARVLGKYTRDENLMPLQTAIYKLTKLPATHSKLQKRGELKVGNYADLVIFDPLTVKDHATFDHPHQYSTGLTDVFVNGVQVLKSGDPTGATPGIFLKGPGFNKR